MVDPISIESKESEEELIYHDDEDHEGGHAGGEEVWLISYADLMTLLMGFFALLTSMATFEEDTFSKIGDQTAKYFGGDVEKPYQKLADKIDQVIKEKGLEDQVETEVLKSEIRITFKGTLFFDSGSIQLKEGARILMDEIISILDENASDKKFLIEGHTDAVPISKGLLASNWELSALRAGAVARLFERVGFEREKILIIGYGETRPKVPHLDEFGNPISKNLAANRRVVLKIMNEHHL